MEARDATARMMYELTDADFLQVQNLVSRLFNRKRKYPKVELPVYTEEDLLKMVERADEQIERGEVVTWEECKERIRKKYGLRV